MASENPTVAAANESTGFEPLNASPSEPQPPKQDPTGDEIPASLTSLSSDFEPVIFPLDVSSNKNSENTSAIPHARQFEDLVKAKVRPSGPSRAEEIDTEAWKSEAGSEGAGVVDKIKNLSDEGQIKIFKVETGVHKDEYYVVGLDLDNERLIAVRYVNH